MPPPTSWSNTIAAFDQSKWLYLKTRSPTCGLCFSPAGAALILMVYEALVLDVSFGSKPDEADLCQRCRLSGYKRTSGGGGRWLSNCAIRH